MATWTKLTQPEQLAVGTIVWDRQRGSDYLGGIVESREGGEIFDVRWLKWDPAIEEPMHDTIYVLDHVNNTHIEVLSKDSDDSDLDFVEYLNSLMSRKFGRTFTIVDLISLMNRYAK